MAVQRVANPIQIALPGQNVGLTADPSTQPVAPWWQVFFRLVARTGGNTGIDSATIQSDLSNVEVRQSASGAPPPTPIPPFPFAISVTASPFSYQAPLSGSVLINGGTVSAVGVSRDHSTFFTCPTAGFVPVFKGDLVRVTYSGAPTMTMDPL